MESIWLLGEILMVNLVLSGDNAVVIAMASKNLPDRHRKKAVWWGAAGAVLLRCILTLAAVLLLKIPYIQAGGGLMLLWIAFKLLMEEEDHIRVSEGSTVWKAIRTILAADFIMSLDNVLAIAGLAKGDLALIVIGIALSIPVVVWGSGIITGWLHRFPILIYLGAYILAYTAGEMLLQDAKLGAMLSFLLPTLHSLLPVALGVAVVAAGGIKRHTPRTG
ncbi:integral membrane protein, YjbE family [Paenibacillus sophorae]|uniref:Integral membrane protein, YjbE family n=1 Tax=Paenibacillus sophorae TaxID=1333845 RepID=A0A1H8R6M6_9BACL|nr:TerC family protein [Paenibacillus sophorae]QWU14966.1 TerC family protein [Paenibacillus sophorae]SEO61977.1 integral membrane protein, YjbE family [Paenibacillus sophorae]